jgi:O-succinylbenzoate synthase
MDLIARAYRIPLRVPFRSLDTREGLLLKGPRGWGEFSPFPEYGPKDSKRWLAAAREAAIDGWPPPLRRRVDVNTTVPAVSPQHAHDLVTASGCRTAKVKVGDCEDVRRVEAVRDALGPAGRIRVDANAAWDVDAARRRIRKLAPFDIEYVEQPVATLDEMMALRKRVDVPLAVDESLRTAPDPLHLDVREAADVVVLKVQPLGGVRRALQIAEAAGVPAVVSSALESSVGIAAGVALAAALPELPYACGLGTVPLLTGDVVADPFVPRDGYLDVRDVEVSPDLGGFEIDAGRWMKRLETLE